MRNTVLDAEAIFVRRRMARETAKQRSLSPRHSPGLFRNATQARGYVDSIAAKHPVGDGGFTNPWTAAGDLIAMTYYMHDDYAQTDDLMFQIVRMIRKVRSGTALRMLDVECSAKGPDTEIIAHFQADRVTVTTFRFDGEEETITFAHDENQYVPVPD